MNAKDMKTMVYLGLAEKSSDAHEWEVYQSLDSAQTYLTRLLPWQVIPEMTKVIEPTIGVPAGVFYNIGSTITRPTDFMELINLMWETNDYDVDDYNEIILRSSRIVTAPVIVTSHELTTDLMCADDGTEILMSQDIGSGWQAEDVLATMIYKYEAASLNDGTSIKIDAKWHHHMVDYALADLWMKFGDKERSVLYNRQLLERLDPQQRQQQPPQGGQR